MRGSLIGLVAAVVCLTAQRAGAEECKEKCDWGTNRELKGHRFVTPKFVDSPFVLTALSLRLGAEMEDVQDYPTRFGTFDLKRVGGSSAVDLSIRLHEMFGLFGTLRGGAQVGSNTPSLVLRGTDYAYEAGGGAMVKLYTNENTGTQLTFRAGGAAGDGKLVSLLPLLGNAADRPIFTIADALTGDLGEFLLTPVSTRRYAAAISVAQSISPMFGVQGALRGEHRRFTYDVFDAVTDTREEANASVTTPSFAAAFTFDATPLGVPVALVPEARLSYVATKSDITTRNRSDFEADGSLGIMYEGRSDFEVGVTAFGSLAREELENVDENGNTAFSQKPKAAGGELVFRYIW